MSTPSASVTGNKRRVAPTPPRRSERLRQQTDPFTHPLYTAISAIRPLFHRFLTDEDAGRLLRVARSFISPILSSFTFHHHIFEPPTLTSLHRMRRVYEENGLRVTQMGIPNVKDLSLDPVTGASPLPSSLLALVLAPPMHGLYSSTAVEPAWAAFSAVAADWQHRPPYCLPEADIGDERYRQLLVMEGTNQRWQAVRFTDPLCDLDCPLPPGLLPSGLRVLQLGHAYNNTPFLPGSLPSTLTFLQTGRKFKAPIAVGTLPASLLHLSLDFGWDQPLEVGVLPPALLMLTMSSNWKQPLLPGVLPASLLALTLSTEWNWPLLPHVLPPSLLRFRLSGRYSHPLVPGVLPASLTSLDLNNSFDHPLHVGVLPASLRELTLSTEFSQRIEKGQLNEGLRYLRFATAGSGQYRRRLEPGVLPSSLVALDLTDRYRQVVEEGRGARGGEVDAAAPLLRGEAGGGSVAAHHTAVLVLRPSNCIRC